MHVIVAGGTGFIGRALVRSLVADGHRVTVLTRRPEEARGTLGQAVEVLLWPGNGAWEQALDGADAVVNLAGESIADGRWTPERKRRLLSSRVEATGSIVEAIRKASRRPAVLVNGSAVGFYGITQNPVGESAPAGADFLAGLTAQWEQKAEQARSLGVRVVLLRTGVVLGEKGGALGRMLLPFRLFVGGPIGSGRQPFPWIHLDDIVGLIRFAITNESVTGPLNGVAPQSVDNAAFSRELGKVMGRPSWLPVPGFALQLAFGEMADAMLLNGQAVVPAAAMRHGYTFRFPELGPALTDILRTGRA